MTVPYGIIPGSLHATKCFTEEELYRCVIDYGGADYFDPGRKSPFKYALVLLSCQRFGDVVLYLWNCQKSLAAAHVSIVLLHYGLVLPHLSLSFPTPTIRAAMPITSDMTPCSILRIWVQQFIPDMAEVAVDYIVSLNTNWVDGIRGLLSKQVEETVRLKSQQSIGEVFEQFLVACDRNQLRSVVGEVGDEEGKHFCRTGGRLDMYISAENVDLLLARAAYLKLTKDIDPDGALHLYSLAGRYKDVIEILTSQLTTGIVNEKGRLKAFKEAKEFYEKYLANNKGHVVAQLESLGRLDLARSLEFLLNICSLFDMISSGKFQDAFAILDTLGIVPREEGEVAVCSQRLAAMDRSVLPVLDVLLLQAMDCVEKFYLTTKSSFRTQPGVATDKENLLQSLRSRARAIVLFAGISGQRLSRSDTCALLARKETNVLI